MVDSFTWNTDKGSIQEQLEADVQEMLHKTSQLKKKKPRPFSTMSSPSQFTNTASDNVLEAQHHFGFIDSHHISW